jgi:hypothetical protein
MGPAHLTSPVAVAITPSSTLLSAHVHQHLGLFVFLSYSLVDIQWHLAYFQGHYSPGTMLALLSESAKVKSLSKTWPVLTALFIY